MIQRSDSEIKNFVLDRKRKCELMMLAQESGVRENELMDIVRGDKTISFDVRFLLSAVWENE